MDAARFDQITKLAGRTASRRRVLAGLVGGVLSALLALAEARKKGKKGKGKKKGKKGGSDVCAAGSGNCPPPPVCERQDECPFGTSCVSQECVLGCIGDDNCDRNELLICEGGLCVPRCFSNDDCPPNHGCRFDGHCTPTDCASDEDCGTGKWCDEGGSCQPGCNSHTHCDDCHLCDIPVHQCCAFAGNQCGLPTTCPG